MCKRGNLVKKSLLILAVGVLMIAQPCFATFKEHFDLGQKYLTEHQYSAAITEFKSALRINYLDNSARIGIVNSYLARGTYYANNDKNWEKAADDYRAALFYLVQYPNAMAVSNSSQAIVQVTSNLNRCLANMQFNTSGASRFNKAKELRAEGNFAAAGYEFSQALSDQSYIKESFQQIGDIMKLVGNNPKAAEYYKKAVAVAPNDIPLRMSYAKILDKNGEADAAVEQYNFILSRINDDKEVLYSLERIYKAKLEVTPNDADVTANLGAIMQKQGNFDEALRYYSKAEYIDPSNVNTRLNVGTLYQEKGDYKTAITAYDSVLVLYPDNVQANLYKGKAYASMDNNQKALEQFKKVLSLDADNDIAQAEMLKIVQKTMTPVQFVEYVKKNSGQNAGNILYTYALQLHKENKLDDSVAMYKEVLKLDGNNPEVYVNLAIAQGQQKKYTDAELTLNNAKAKFPSNKQVSDTIAQINAQASDMLLDTAADLYNNGDYQNAINAYLKVSPQTADTNLAIASAYQNLKDIPNAIAYYKKALSLKPSDSNIAYYIAALYADQEDYAQSEIYADKAISLDKNNKDAIALKQDLKDNATAVDLQNAIAAFESGDNGKALPLLNRVLSSDSNNSYALYYRGMVYDAQQKYSDAINDYKKALNGGNEDLSIVNYLIAVDYDSLGQYKDAKMYFQNFVGKYAQDDDYKKYAQTRLTELKDVK